MAGVPKDPGVAPAELMRRLPEQVALGDALLADDARTLQCIMRWVSAFPTARAAAR